MMPRICKLTVICVLLFLLKKQKKKRMMMLWWHDRLLIRFDPLSGWFGQQGFQPGVFMGAGQRLVPAGAPGADDHNNRPVGDLAGMSTCS